MKRTIFIYLFILTGIQPIFSSTVDSIPNAGFEQWMVAPWDYSPVNWVCSNSELLAATVLIDSASYTGLLAMKLSYSWNVIPYAWCGFPISSHPHNLGGYMKNLLNQNDSAMISARIYRNQVLVDSGSVIVYGGINPNYVPFVIPIDQNSPLADSCVIYISGSHMWGSEISFDDLEFDFQVGVEEADRFPLRYYPNPCRENVTIEIGNHVDLPISVTAYDLTGREFGIPVFYDYLELELPASRQEKIKCRLNTEKLSAGLWLIQLKNEKFNQYIPVIKQ